MPGTVVETAEQWGPIGVVTLTCTADAAAADYPSTALLAKIGGKLIAMDVNPGPTGPTDLYDAVLNDDGGLDILQGLGANLLIATSESKAIVRSGTEIHPPVSIGDTLTLVLTNNSVNSALTVIKLYFEGQIRFDGQ
jgi:hypothetical protein